MVATRSGTPLRAYARDIKSAYRAVGVQRATLPLQLFVWCGGVAVDERLEFGTASAPQLFQRLTSVLCSFAASRQRAWDDAHPPSHAATQSWLARRRTDGRGAASLGFLQVYLDDATGVVLDDREPDWPEGRAAAHFKIVGDILTQAGFTISLPKDQLGTDVVCLGFRLSLSSRRMSLPPEKAAALQQRIRQMLKQRNAPFLAVQQLVGVITHVCAIVAEGKQPLDDIFDFMWQRGRRVPKGSSNGPSGGPRAHLLGGPSGGPRAHWLAVGGAAPRACGFRHALQWFDEALAEDVSVPLAPRLVFPADGERGTAFCFVDASREWGIGGWSLIRQHGSVRFIALAAAYPHDLADHIADTAIGCTSTAAIELAAAAAVSAVLRDASRFSSLTLFIDNEAARGAINLGSSRVPSLRPLLRALFQPSEQILAVRVSTTANSFADRLSRGDSAAVLRDAAALGWPQTLHGSDGVDWQPLRSAVERRTL